MKKTLIVVTLWAFGALTTAALMQEGLSGIFASIFHSFASMQIFADLVISLVLIMIWMWHDARSSGTSPWPWIGLTLLAGAFGPLLYLLTRKSGAALPD